METDRTQYVNCAVKSSAALTDAIVQSTQPTLTINRFNANHVVALHSAVLV